MRAVVTVVVLLSLAGAAAAGWEDNRCVSCHETESLPISLGHSVAEWKSSAHARGGVGCEKCHGGDAGVAELPPAHRGVLPAADPGSTIHPTRLPATCGACHPKELAAFEKSVHMRELKTHGTGATCFTCHGAMATSYPSPSELQARCAVCHKKPVQAQTALSMMAAAKLRLRRTQRSIEAAKATNPPWYDNALGRFHDLERMYARMQLDWHAFDTAKVLQEGHDLVKLGGILGDEAGVMAHQPPPAP